MTGTVRATTSEPKEERGIQTTGGYEKKPQGPYKMRKEEAGVRKRECVRGGAHFRCLEETVGSARDIVEPGEKIWIGNQTANDREG